MTPEETVAMWKRKDAERRANAVEVHGPKCGCSHGVPAPGGGMVPSGPCRDVERRPYTAQPLPPDDMLLRLAGAS